MKKIILVALVLLGTGMGSLCKGQFNTYHPFPDSNAGWCETQWSYAFGSCPPSLGGERFVFYSYYVNGDTTVNGKKYCKLRNSGGYTALSCGSLDSTCYSYFSGLLRNDTLARKVFLAVGLRDTLLYDFSLQVGDTLPDSYINSRRWGNYVESIDSILVGTTYRKQFIISNLYFGKFDSIIEGIGSALGMMENLQPTYGHGTYLSYFIDTTIVFPLSADGITKLIYNCAATGIGSIEKYEQSLTVFPNPSRGVFTFEIKNEKLKVKNVEVYNVLGEKIYSSFTIYNSQFTIDLRSKPNGVYFYRVIGEDGSLVGDGKLIIQK